MARLIPVAESRALARAHRILGSALALLVAVWFVSGAVMLFHGYPYAELRERLVAAPQLSSADLEPVAVSELSRGLRAGRRVRIHSGPQGVVVDGDSGLRGARGGPVRRSSSDECLAHLLTARPALPVVFAETVHDVGQWTVPESIRSRLPLYRYTTPAEEHFYLDPFGCGLVQHSKQGERIWAYFGAIPHWVYLAPLRMYRETWRFLVITLSLLGLATCLSGLLRGASILRGRKRAEGTLRFPTSPIRKPLLRFHHMTGLLFGTVASTWLLSGAMSLSPVDLNPTQLTPAEALRRYTLGSAMKALGVRPVAALSACQGQLSAVHLLEVFTVGGLPHYLCYDADGRTAVVPATARSAQAATARLGRSLLRSASAGVLPGQLQAFERLQKPDAYYYPRHGDAHHELDIYRVSFADPEETTLYLSPTTGRVLRHQASGLRLQRWLYHGLHSLDFPALYRHSGLWYTVVLVLLLGGGLLSFSAVVLSGRVLRRAAVRRKSRK